MKLRFARSLISAKSIVGICALLGLVMFCEPVPAATITNVLCNTGFDALCKNELNDGAIDLNYTLTLPSTSTSSAYVVNQSPLPVPWLGDTSVSKWIGPAADQRFGFFNTTGLYIYHLEVDVSGTGSLDINGRWLVDDEATIFGDGSAVLGNWTTGSSSIWTNFEVKPTILSGPTSIHSLDFRVSNFQNATGLRVEFIPEPSVLALTGGGLVGLGFWRRRRRGSRLLFTL